MSSIQKNEPSLMIPMAFANIRPERVKAVIERQAKLGTVERIDTIEKEFRQKDGSFQLRKRFFVHFKEWSETVSVDDRVEISNGTRDLKIEYDKPYYWKCRGVEYKSEADLEQDRFPVVAVDVVEPESKTSDK